MNGTGTGTLHISANGVDYDGNGFVFNFQEPSDIYRIAPQSGPKDTSCQVKMIGGGLRSNSQLYVKLGNYHLDPIHKDQVQQAVWSQDSYLSSMLMNRQDTMQFKAVWHKLYDQQNV